MAVKYVFVTGGVVSGLGKGITAASLGRLLKARGYQVTMQKFDPYINIDPGTMNPIQHGEVFVTDDGTETDLDLGHYERFIDESLDKNSNVTTGKVYWSVLQKERHGDFGGGTVQVIPHITNEIKSRFYRAKSPEENKIAIIEVGGTVGDIESQPFLEAIRQFQLNVGHDNAILIHVTLIPYLKASEELKTKTYTGKRKGTSGNGNPAEGEEEDPRAELVEKLLEYKMYKFMSYELKDKMDDAANVFFKEPTIPDEVLQYREPVDPKELLAGLTLEKLNAIYKSIIRRQEDKVDPIRSKFGTIEKEEVSLSDKMIEIKDFARTHQKFSFRNLLESQCSKVQVIVTFLSILELMKMGHIHVEQDRLFDDISVEVQTDPDTWKNLTEFAEDEPQNTEINM